MIHVHHLLDYYSLPSFVVAELDVAFAAPVVALDCEFVDFEAAVELELIDADLVADEADSVSIAEATKKMGSVAYAEELADVGVAAGFDVE